MVFDSKLNFKEHILQGTDKGNNRILIIRKLRLVLPLQMFCKTIYFSNGDVIYDQPGNASTIQKIESVQCEASLAITKAIKGSSREKLYRELRLESLECVVGTRNSGYCTKF